MSRLDIYMQSNVTSTHTNTNWVIDIAPETQSCHENADTVQEVPFVILDGAKNVPDLVRCRSANHEEMLRQHKRNESVQKSVTVLSLLQKTKFRKSK
jgi:hypothetical protein